MTKAAKPNETHFWKKKYHLPDKIGFNAAYSLDAGHRLNLEWSESKSSNHRTGLRLNAEIINVSADSITFRAISKKKFNKETFQAIELQGRWQADEFNRLTFLVKRNKGIEDALIFQGAWEVNKNNTLIYKYKTVDLKTRKKKEAVLLFKGFWDITEKERLTYILDLKKDSYFSFRVQLESPNLTPKQGVIKYRLGIGTDTDKTGKVETISLFGSWKFNRKSNVSFTMDYGNGRFKKITFGTGLLVTKKDNIVCQLTKKNGQKLGINLVLSHKLLNDNAELFLKASRNPGESRIETGLKVYW